MSSQEALVQVQRRYPGMAIPNGWFAIAMSAEVKRGEVKPLTAFGKELVIFRGDDGKATVLDAYCPHLGAHFGHGGKVKGNEIECPFHAWRFDAEGRCAHAPFAKKLPVAAVRCWPVHESAGFVFTYHDRAGGAPSEPPPDLSRYEQGWARLKGDRAEYAGHPIEAAENVIDAGHFVYFHSASAPAELDFANHGKTATMRTRFQVRGLPVIAKMAVDLLGAGLLVVRTELFTDVHVITTPVPIDSGRTLFRMTVFARKRLPFIAWLAAAIIRRRANNDARRERAIWEHKAYLHTPRLSSVDRHIQPFRAWYRQFI